MRPNAVIFALVACIALNQPAAFALDTQKDIVDRAREYVGSAYVRGGTRPPEFDCSGFVGYIMRPYAPKLPRLSRDMAGFGTKVAKEALRPGDLVFFATTDVPGAVSHVAIFIGDGSIIHAISDGPERGVRVTALDARYWKTHYHSATRVLAGNEAATAKADTQPAEKPDAKSAAKTGETVKPATAKTADAKTADAKTADAKTAKSESSPWDTWDGYVMGDYAQWKEAERAKLEAQEKAYDRDKETNDFEAWKKANGE
jgi:hypothetical protein